MKKEDLLDGRAESIVIPTISSTSMKLTTRGISDTKQEDLTATKQVVELNRHNVGRVYRKIKPFLNNKTVTALSHISKDLIKDMANIHGVHAEDEAKEYANDQTRFAFAEKMAQDIEPIFTDSGFTIKCEATRIILTEEDLIDLIIQTIAEWETVKN